MDRDDDSPEPFGSLHESVRELGGAESRASVARAVLDAATAVLDVAAVGVFLRDDESGRLGAVATTGDRALPDAVGPEAGWAAVWDAYAAGETRFVTAPAPVATAGGGSDPGDGLLVPVGDHGVLACLGPGVGPDAATVRLVETATASAANALDRLDSEQRRRTSESRLRAEREQHEDAARLVAVLRGALRALVAADSRGGLQTAVCEAVADSDRVGLCWIGHRSADAGALTVDAWAGNGRGYLDHLLAADGDEQPPAHRALDAGEAVTVDRIARSEAFAPWRGPALSRGFRSVACLPLTWRDREYGFMECYGTRPGHAEGEVPVLSEIATTVANAINALERKEALISGQSTLVEVAIDDADDPLFELARRADVRLEVDSVVPRADGSWLVYLVLRETDPEPVVGSCERFVSIEDVTVVRSEDDLDLLGLTVSKLALIETLGTHGATVQSIELGPDGGTVTVSLPPSTDVRTFVESCEQSLGSLRLRRREPTSPTGSVTGLRYTVADLLTERQLEALRTGYAHGFFEVPRDHTGEQVASELGVSGPTFRHHVRKGIRRILAEVFEAETVESG